MIYHHRYHKYRTDRSLREGDDAESSPKSLGHKTLWSGRLTASGLLRANFLPEIRVFRVGLTVAYPAGSRPLYERCRRGRIAGTWPTRADNSNQGEHKMTKTTGFAMIVIGVAWCVPAAGADEPSTHPATQPSTQPAKELTLDLGNKVTMKLALIPAGKFLMGSPKEEKGRLDSEGPQYEVTISKPFYMGVYEVTQEQWTAVMGTAPWKGKEYAKDGATHAANYVSWDDATDFCKKVSTKTGKTVSLPTEAQWEYACRAGSKTRFSYGDDPDYAKLGDYAWYFKNAWDVGEKYAHAVGQKKPNDFGLYDMHGNVWQWCSDWYDKDYYANAEKTDPSGSASGTFRVLRGGSFYDGGGSCRSAVRGLIVPAVVWRYFGFRVVVAPGL
jgi:sulfatase modifying factor 1